MILAAIAFLAMTGLMGLTAQAPTALAHSNGVSSSPDDGEIVDALPPKVEVTFDAGLMDIGAALAVVGPDGAVVSDATPTIGKRTISTALTGSGLPGVYKVAYRIVSEDGHAVEGKYAFTVAGAAAPSASAETTTPLPESSSEAAPDAATDAVTDTETATPTTSVTAPVEPISAATQAPVAQSGGSSAVPWVLIGVAVVVAIAGAVVIIRRRD